MGQRGPNARPIAIRPTPEVLANRDPHPWEKKGLSRAERVAVFLETLPISSGSQRGTNFKVRDWQWKEIIEPIYATNAEGRRYVREAIISIPRKNGKTGIVAGLAACHLVGPEAVERGQVFSAANARKQAGLIFNELEAIVNRRAWMRERVNVRRFDKQMEDLGLTESVYQALAAEVHTEHGLSASFWIYDELGQAKKRDLYDVLSTSGAAWEEPLGVVISTQAAFSMHVMSELIDDGIQIREGIVDDPSRYACIYQAPMDADIWDVETWKASNPALGDFRSMQEMEDYAKKAKRIPTMESKFRNLYLNQRISADPRWVPRPTWDLCGMEFTAEDLHGRTCLGALDLSGSGHNDLTSLVLRFAMDDETARVIPFFWAAEDRLEEAGAKDRVPYALWVKQGHLKTTPGRVLDYKGMVAQIGELLSSYDFKLELLAVDPWSFERFEEAVNEVELDLSVVKWGQGYAQMHPAIEAAENDITSGKLRHNRNPILGWCIDNVKIGLDSSGNRKFDKRKATGRIDGAQALAMVSGLSRIPSEEPEYSVFFVG